MFEDKEKQLAPLEEVEYEFTLKPDTDEVLSQYILHFHGWVEHWDGEVMEYRKIAEIEGIRMDLASAHADGLRDDDLLGMISNDVADFSDVVLHHENCLVDKDLHSNEKVECNCLVFINEIRVDEKFRGHGLGSNLMQRLPSMMDMSDCLMALKAFPLASDYSQATSSEDIKRIKHFYEQLGFEHVGGEFMTKDARLCEAIKKRLMGRNKVGRETTGGEAKSP
jgi:GNAT superfamily N-acetyltransferase